MHMNEQGTGYARCRECGGRECVHLEAARAAEAEAKAAAAGASLTLGAPTTPPTGRGEAHRARRARPAKK